MSVVEIFIFAYFEKMSVCVCVLKRGKGCVWNFAIKISCEYVHCTVHCTYGHSFDIILPMHMTIAYIIFFSFCNLKYWFLKKQFQQLMQFIRYFVRCWKPRIANRFRKHDTWHMTHKTLNSLITIFSSAFFLSFIYWILILIEHTN